MQSQVPQFLEVEDKLFGFMTFKQFLFIAGGAGALYVSYSFLPIWFAVPVFVVVVPTTLGFAFVKVNKKPFIFFAEAFLKYFSSSRLYIWKKVPKKIEHKEDPKAKNAPLTYVPRLSENKLKELAWTLDVRSHER
ncbi:PrgI family protein [bacterium]|nr:PrgI family protein [bacterium]